MNRAVSIWKKLFFKNNAGRIRKTVMDYLKEENIKAEIKDGLIYVELEETRYVIDFNLEGEYPLCFITCRAKDEDYEALDTSKKTFAADIVNTEETRHSIAKAFNAEVIVDAHFYFSDKKMLLSLFYDYFTDLKDAMENMCGYLNDMIKENKKMQQRRVIGFVNNAAAKENEKDKVSAYKKQELK